MYRGWFSSAMGKLVKLLVFVLTCLSTLEPLPTTNLQTPVQLVHELQLYSNIDSVTTYDTIASFNGIATTIKSSVD